jgi:hypothetical protein
MAKLVVELESDNLEHAKKNVRAFFAILQTN